jgi:hypothetical protein
MDRANSLIAAAKKVAVVTAAVCAVAASSLAGVSNASAETPLLHKTVKMTLSKSIPPAPRFLVRGVCGVSGPVDTTSCTKTIVAAIDEARKSEPLNAIPPSFSVTAFNKLTNNEQIFAIADIERTARGLAPIAAITTQLDAIAASGASRQNDPSAHLPLRLTDGGIATAYGSNWAEGTANALGADYYWMYDDGPNSPNSVCHKAGEAGCWGHRENILFNYNNANYCPSGSKITTVMGVAEITTKVAYSPSIAEIFTNDCGALPRDAFFTWPDVQKLVFGH